MANEPTAGTALPTSLGKPALRALAAAGIHNLVDVARVSEQDLRALHGVGPKAIRVLQAALAGQSG